MRIKQIDPLVITGLSLSINLKKCVKAVSIYDLDIVNPYFRTVDATDILEKNGVELVDSPYAETNVDIPAMNSKSYQMVDDINRYAVVDIGGDDRGALALGRFSDKIKLENDYEMLLVVNKYRPETRDFSGVLEIKNEIEKTARINFTGVVNNSNLGVDTTAETITDSFEFINEVSKKTGLPVKFTAVRKDLTEKVKEKEKENKILPIELIKYGDWL